MITSPEQASQKAGTYDLTLLGDTADTDAATGWGFLSGRRMKEPTP